MRSLLQPPGSVIISTPPANGYAAAGRVPVENVDYMYTAKHRGVLNPALPLDALFANGISNSTAFQCSFIEDAFEDGFQYPLLNTTRWVPLSATTLDHCPKPGAVGAANPQTCTALMASQMQFGVPLPNHPTGDIGLIITLSQAPCTGSNCCVGGVCANWASARLLSRGCIHYGVLEAEASFNIPQTSGAIGFLGFYMYGGPYDNSWNEVDQTFVNGAYGTEFHCSLFISNPASASNAQEDKDVFDGSGTDCNSYVPAKGLPGNLKGNLQPYSCPVYNTQTALGYHTYKVLWTYGWIAWMIDTTIYRNSTNVPWRPVTLRPLLRTNIGTAASVAPLPNANIYLRRIRYQPLDPAGQVISDALRCPSMLACYGPLAQNAAGMMQLANPSINAATSAAGRRRLQQGLGATLSTNGSQLAPSVGPTVTSPYLTELTNITAVAQRVVASTIPGILPGQVMISIVGHTISGVIRVTGMSFSSWNTTVQSAFVIGLSQDVVPDATNVFINNVLDASVQSNWPLVTTQVPTSYTPGVLLQYNIDGYQCNATAPPGSCNDAGWSIANGDVSVLNNIGPANFASAAVSTYFPYAVLADASPGTPGASGLPSIAATIGVGINVFSGPNTIASALLEAQFDSALNTGLISNALAAAGIGSAMAPTNVQTARATRMADNAGGCPVITPVPNILSCPALASKEQTYKAISIAFIVAFGVLMIGIVVGAVIAVISLKTQLLIQKATADAIPASKL